MFCAKQFLEHTSVVNAYNMDLSFKVTKLRRNIRKQQCNYNDIEMLVVIGRKHLIEAIALTYE